MLPAIQALVLLPNIYTHKEFIMTETGHIAHENIETHPLAPFMPEGSRILMLGTFPPARSRWCMDFFYPNFQNDMWRIMGLCFFNDKEYFIIKGEKRFDQTLIEAFLHEQRIAVYDTARKVVRTKNTASDKDLLIVEETDIRLMLDKMPECDTIITTGQLATTTLCRQLDIAEPKVGHHTSFTYGSRRIKLFRMPSSSRAYPLSVERKAEQYAKCLKEGNVQAD